MGVRGRYQPDPPAGSDDPLGVGDVPIFTPSDSQPIGVPADYQARPWEDPRTYSYDSRGRIVPVPQGRRRGSLTPVSSGKGGDEAWPYYDGDEFFPGQLSPQAIAQLQRQMAALGLLPPNARFRLGVWDQASQKAYRTLLAYANQQGMSFQQAMAHMEATGMNATVDEFGNLVTGEGQTQEPLPTRTSNPDELKLVFRKAVIDTLGQGWDEGKIDQMVRSYNDLEVKQQRAAYDAELTGGNVVSVPSPEAFAVTQATTQDPAAAQGEEMLGFMDEFQQLVTSPAWGAS